MARIVFAGKREGIVGIVRAPGNCMRNVEMVAITLTRHGESTRYSNRQQRLLR